MEHEYITTLTRLSLALLVGGVIGLERSYHGRPAGFRTHTLVCVSSSLLMVLSVFQWQLVDFAPMETIRVDPTRMAQGIMTGIGFLGAGVILKDGLSVRGLTTASSVWITAAIGIVIGMGLYFAAFVATLYTIVTLIVFRWIERIIPTLNYAQLVIRFSRNERMNEQELRELIVTHDLQCSNLSYQLDNEGKIFQYKMTVITVENNNYKNLVDTLSKSDNIIEFDLSPTSD